jgi:hypothetical protein
MNDTAEQDCSWAKWYCGCDQVEEIKLNFAAGVPITKLAREYDIRGNQGRVS